MPSDFLFGRSKQSLSPENTAEKEGHEFCFHIGPWGELFVWLQRRRALPHGVIPEEIEGGRGFLIFHLFTAFSNTIQRTLYLFSIFQEILWLFETDDPLCGHIDPFFHSDGYLLPRGHCELWLMCFLCFIWTSSLNEENTTEESFGQTILATYFSLVTLFLWPQSQRASVTSYCVWGVRSPLEVNAFLSDTVGNKEWKETVHEIR